MYSGTKAQRRGAVGRCSQKAAQYPSLLRGGSAGLVDVMFTALPRRCRAEQDGMAMSGRIWQGELPGHAILEGAQRLPRFRRGRSGAGGQWCHRDQRAGTQINVPVRAVDVVPVHSDDLRRAVGLPNLRASASAPKMREHRPWVQRVLRNEHDRLRRTVATKRP